MAALAPTSPPATPTPNSESSARSTPRPTRGSALVAAAVSTSRCPARSCSRCNRLEARHPERCDIGAGVGTRRAKRKVGVDDCPAPRRTAGDRSRSAPPERRASPIDAPWLARARTRSPDEPDAALLSMRIPPRERSELSPSTSDGSPRAATGGAGDVTTGSEVTGGAGALGAGAGVAATGGADGSEAGAGGASGAGGGPSIGPRGGSRSRGSTYASALPTRTLRCTYGTVCSGSPEGPVSATVSPSATVCPR